MFLSMHEQERLLVYTAGKLALERKARGLKLNLPETTAVITSFLLEGARLCKNNALSSEGGGPEPRPNKSSNPKSLRSNQSVAEEACHAFASTKRVGLTHGVRPQNQY